MGLLGDAWKARKMKDPVDGVAQVVGSTQPPDSATSSNVNLTLVVQAEGVPATTIEHSCIAPNAQMNQGAGGQVVMGGGADVNEIVQALQQQYPGAQIEVEGGQVMGDAQAPQEDDRVAQLERLAKLKESGALTEEEFEREKARLLGS